MKATAIFTLGAFIPLTVFSLVLGPTSPPGSREKALQLMLYTPAILSSVVAALIWMLIFDPRGLGNAFVNFLLQTPGINHNWLTDPVMLQMSTITIYVWKYIGYFTIIYVTVIAKIPQSTLEAATIDGASAMQTVMRVIMPCCGPPHDGLHCRHAQ